MYEEPLYILNYFWGRNPGWYLNYPGLLQPHPKDGLISARAKVYEKPTPKDNHPTPRLSNSGWLGFYSGPIPWDVGSLKCALILAMG